MRLARCIAAFLLGVAAWNVVTWANFARNLSEGGNDATSFYVVHGALIAVNLAVAGVLAAIGLRGWRAAGAGTGEHGSDTTAGHGAYRP